MFVNKVFVRSLLMESNKEDLVVVFTRKLFIEFDGISRKQRYFLLVLQDGCWLILMASLENKEHYVLLFLNRSREVVHIKFEYNLI